MLRQGAFFEGDILMHLYITVLPAPLRPGLAPQSGGGRSEAGEEQAFTECGVDEESDR